MEQPSSACQTMAFLVMAALLYTLSPSVGVHCWQCITACQDSKLFKSFYHVLNVHTELLVLEAEEIFWKMWN